MLPKNRRLTAPEVRAILQRGRLTRGEGVSCKYVAAGAPKMAVVVSKKTANEAVMRNQLRRAGYRVLQATALPNVHAVFFITTRSFDPGALKKLCSRLS